MNQLRGFWGFFFAFFSGERAPSIGLVFPSSVTIKSDNKTGR